jgi:ABC-type branched-subunit amino acid transport system ATPase component
VRQGVVLVPEGRQVFPELSVLDNIRLGAFLYPQDVEARVEEMLGRFPRCASACITAPGCSPAASSRCWPSHAA